MNKSPLVALEIDNRFRDDVISGDKSITIRENWRDYKVGELVVLCHTNHEDRGWAIKGMITKVEHCFLKDVSKKDLNDYKVTDLQDAINCLSEFYPTISESSPVSVIRWTLI